MAQENNNEDLKELTESINNLRITNSAMVTKMEQLYTSIEKLESSIEKLEKVTEGITSVVSSQDRRIAVLEQINPPALIQDIAVLKATQALQNKLVWLFGSVTAATLIQNFIKLL